MLISIIVVVIIYMTQVFACNNLHHGHNYIHIPSPNAKINFTALLVPFDLSQVLLTEGSIEYEGQELNKQYIRMIDLDHLLYTTYMTAGIKTTAEPLGGWESPEHPLRGNFIRIFITALAKSYSTSHDPDMKNRCDYIVKQIKNVKMRLVLDMSWLSQRHFLTIWKH